MSQEGGWGVLEKLQMMFKDEVDLWFFPNITACSCVHKLDSHLSETSIRGPVLSRPAKVDFCFENIVNIH